MRRAAIIGAAVLAGAFGWCVWPTLYRYHQWEKWPVRENRITGATRHYIINRGWVADREPLPPTPPVLSPAEAAERLRAKATDDAFEKMSAARPLDEVDKK
jgi:hypothetical protein